MSTQVQSVIFEKSKYSVTQAKKWLRDNGFVAPKVDKTDRYLRFRQKQPGYFDESSFRTIPFGKGKGIKAIIGVPMQSNPFYDELDPDGDGHRIGAYAMLFTKAKNEWKRTGDPLELAKAKQYWDQYLHARDQYETIEDREGSKVLLHEMESFENAIQNPKTKSNPMNRHQLINELNDRYRNITHIYPPANQAWLISGAIGKEGSLILTEYRGLWEIFVIDQWGNTPQTKETIEEINYEDHIGTWKDAIQWLMKQRNNPMKTHKNPVVDGKTIVDNLQGLRKMIRKSYASTKKLGSKQIRYDIVSIWLALQKLDSLGRPAKYAIFSGKEKGKPYIAIIYDSGMGSVLFLITGDKKGRLSGIVKYLAHDKDSALEHIENVVYDQTGQPSTDSDLEEFVYDAPSGFIKMIDKFVVEDKDLKNAQYEVEPYKKNPHCHCYGHKKNPHCSVHGNPRKGRDEKLVGKVYEAFLEKNVVPYTMIDTFIDEVAGRIVSAGERSDILDLLLDMEVISICCEDDCDFGGSYRLTNEGNRGLWYCDTGVKRNPLGTAYRQGVMSGLAYRFNPPKKIMSFESFMDNLADGNVFVGRYVIFVQDGVPMRLEVGSSTPKKVSPEVAFYADLAGQAELVGTSDIDAFSDDYRGLIRQASDASSGGVVAGGAVPVVEVEEMEEVVIPPSAPMPPIPDVLEQLAELEAVFENAQNIKTEWELDGGSSKLKYLLKEVLTFGKRDEKEVISRLQVLADSKRAKSPKTLTAKILKRYIKMAEKSMGAKIDMVDDDTGRKTTPEKEAEQIVEEAQEEVVAPAPAPVDPVAARLAAMAEQQADFIGGFKKNPRSSHYAYNMSTLDHNHRMDYVPLNNVYIKKNPSDGAFRFPQTKVLGVDIDNDIYTWLSSSLPDWNSLLPLLTGKYAKYKASVETLANQAKQFMVTMQTEIVPAVEAKVKKQLASGKTLKDIIGKAKKNPTRRTVRRNTKRRRRYY